MRMNWRSKKKKEVAAGRLLQRLAQARYGVALAKVIAAEVEKCG